MHSTTKHNDPSRFHFTSNMCIEWWSCFTSSLMARLGRATDNGGAAIGAELGRGGAERVTSP